MSHALQAWTVDDYCPKRSIVMQCKDVDSRSDRWETQGLQLYSAYDNVNRGLMSIIIIIINDNFYSAVLVTMVTARVHPVHLMNADWAPGGRQPSGQPTWPVSPPINGCYHPHPPSPFVIITQPESWHSFYRPTEGGRLSWPRHCLSHVNTVERYKAWYCCWLSIYFLCVTYWFGAKSDWLNYMILTIVI